MSTEEIFLAAIGLSFELIGIILTGMAAITVLIITIVKRFGKNKN